MVETINAVLLKYRPIIHSGCQAEKDVIDTIIQNIAREICEQFEAATNERRVAIGKEPIKAKPKKRVIRRKKE